MVPGWAAVGVASVSRAVDGLQPIALCGRAGTSGSSGCGLSPQPSKDSVNYLHPLINPLLLNLAGSVVCREELRTTHHLIQQKKRLTWHRGREDNYKR